MQARTRLFSLGVLLALIPGVAVATCYDLGGQTNCDSTLSVGGRLAVGTVSPVASANILNIVPTLPTMILQNASGQTADTLDIENSNGVVLSSVDVNGNWSVPSVTISSSVNLAGGTVPIISTFTSNDTVDSITFTPYTGYCFGGSLFCVDPTTDPARGLRVNIATSTSYRHAGLTVNYTLNKPQIILDNSAGFSSALQLRISDQGFGLVGGSGVWLADTSSTMSVVGYTSDLNFYSWSHSTPDLIISTGGIKGVTTNSNAPSGIVGQVVVSSGTSLSWGTASSNFGDATSVVLSSGDWDVNACATFNLNTATGWTQALIGVSTTTGNSAAGLNYGDTEADFGAPPTSNNNVSQCLSGIRASLSANTTYYLKLRVSYSGGAPLVLGYRISARRPR